MKVFSIFPITIIIVMFLISTSVQSQDKPNFPHSHLSNFLDTIPGELTYVHTDRDLYSQYDTIWFKIYLTDAHTHLPLHGLQNVYVELISESGTEMVRNLIQVNNGFGNGDLSFTEYEVEPGSYVLRAYTNYQQNFGDEFIFRKNIRVTDIFENQIAMTEKAPKTSKSPVSETSKPIDLQFLPEGGHLTSLIPNKLAFRAVAANGHSIDVSGSIQNDEGITVAQFKSVHNGMGKIKFYPEKNKTYTATIDGFPGLEYKLPSSTDELQLSVDVESDSVIIVKLVKNEAMPLKSNYYLENTSSGKVLFYIPIEMNGPFVRIKLEGDKFGLGINQITLTDDLMRPLAERLIFVKNRSFLNISVKTEKETYGNREKVKVDISSLVGTDTIPANLSVSVVNQSQAISTDDYPQNILSYFLLDSELRGNIENPSYYFRNDSANTREELDLLMLTQGWRSYNWNAFADELPTMKCEKENGLVLRGRLKRLLSKKGAENGKVTVFMQGKAGELFISETTSDSLGNFNFPPSVFPDSISAFIQGLNKKDKKNTEILNVSTFSPAAPFNSLNYKFPSFELPSNSEFIKKAYLRLAADKEYHPEKYEILLDEIEVTEKVRQDENDDGHSRMYGMADDVLVIDDEANSYSDIWSYIGGRVAGVLVSGNSVTIRGGGSFAEGGSTPYFLLDGIPVEKDNLDGIPMTMIDKIEILKDVANLALFGSKGANGVIAVYTKRGSMYEKEIFYTGITTEKLRGYYLPRVFYSPNYELETDDMPDHRATIYWNPNLAIQKSEQSSISFFTSDDFDPILIKVEGLSYDGRPGVGFFKLNIESSEK